MLPTLIYVLLAFALASSETIRIDDTSGDPTNAVRITYPVSWSQGQSCSGCQSKPDPSQVYMGTWHDFIGVSNVTVDFSGAGAISVYGILDIGIFGPTDLTFYIDGKASGSYLRLNNNRSLPRYQYNVQFFSFSSLAQGHHTMIIESGRRYNLSMDFIAYDPSSSPNLKSSSRSATIVGAVCGGLAAVLLIGLTIWFLRRRKQPDPFLEPFPPNVTYSLPHKKRRHRRDKHRRKPNHKEGLKPPQSAYFTESHLNSDSLAAENKVLREALIHRLMIAATEEPGLPSFARCPGQTQNVLATF
ncbi:hypothetical protein C8J56DRAFT_182644 [Mycena floridula]|nr:hypothetical protein C8J56DRAFT_182644 [Mycena floridula]